VIATDPALIVRTSAVRGPVAVTVAIATLLLVHPTVVKGNGEPSAAVAVARTSTESPTTRLLVDADTWMVRMDGGNGDKNGVDSLQAVTKAAASMIVRTFVIAEHSAGLKEDANRYCDLPASRCCGRILGSEPHSHLISASKFAQS
jgi:hypothetical protein